MNLYVSNLGFNVTEQELKNLFAQHGQVSSVKIITDYNTGQSRGFGFVEMANDSEAEKAMTKLNNTEINNRSISVQVARPKEDKPKKSNYPERDGFKRY
jgi:RNA recognition motif-containing protein